MGGFEVIEAALVSLIEGMTQITHLSLRHFNNYTLKAPPFFSLIAIKYERRFVYIYETE